MDGKDLTELKRSVSLALKRSLAEDKALCLSNLLIQLSIQAGDEASDILKSVALPLKRVMQGHHYDRYHALRTIAGLAELASKAEAMNVFTNLFGKKLFVKSTEPENVVLIKLKLLEKISLN